MPTGKNRSLRFTAIALATSVALAAFAEDRTSVASAVAPAASNQAGLSQRDKKILVQAVFRVDKYIGYRVYPGHDKEAFARIGLESGDLITAINGKSLANLKPFGDTLETLCPSADATVEISLERNGQALILEPQCKKL